MMEEKLDRRVQRTRRQLRTALTELMSEKPHKRISVRELADRASINRGTFYVHYRDVRDFMQQLQDEIANGLSDMCRRHSGNTEISSYPFLTDLYHFVWDNGDLCRVLLGHNGDIAYRQRIGALLCEEFLYDFVSRYHPEDRQQLEHACSFIVSGSLNLALEWLDRDSGETAEDMARVTGQLIMNGVATRR